jgi:hypothetical protein
MNNNVIKTKHNLDFEVAPWRPTTQFILFRVGTCAGLWTSTDKTYDILAVQNESKGNGHFDDVLEWFEFSCKRDNKNLRFLETWNQRLRKHLIEKRGFFEDGPDNLIKSF